MRTPTPHAAAARLTPARHAATLLAPLSLIALLSIPRPAAAEPYPAFAHAPRLSAPVSPYSEDPQRWTAERVSEALALADSYLDVCGIDLEPGPLLPLRPGSAARPQRLWRTDRANELVLVLRAEGDNRHYALHGIASLRKVDHRWLGEAPWAPVVLALAEVIGARRLKTWPSPTGETAATVMGEARVAMLWAAARGWITLAPAIDSGHCTFLREKFAALGKKPDDARSKRRQPWSMRPMPTSVRAPVRLPSAPTALLMADVPNSDAFALAFRVADTWRMATWTPDLRRAAPKTAPLRADGEGVALVRVGGASLVVSTRPDGTVAAQWWHPDATRRGDFRADRTLKGCSRVLAVDALRPPARGPGGEADPGAALVVCPERVFQLAPLPAYRERDDAITRSTWATLTRWGPGRSRLLTGTADRLRAYDLNTRAPPRDVPASPAAVALWRAHPQGPVWWAPGADPIQVAKGALHGLPGGSRAVGEDAIIRVNPQSFRAVRVHTDPTGRQARVDALYAPYPFEKAAGGPVEATLPAGSPWATHLGDYGPLLWAVVPDGEGWAVVAPGPAGVVDRKVGGQVLP